MFSGTENIRPVKAGPQTLRRLAAVIRGADAVIVGAGAGLSASAGFAYEGERFERYFADFAEKYPFQDMYSGGFYPFGTKEEYWAYWSRYIVINRYQDAPGTVYWDLLRLVKNKDYFVITTNVDHCFLKAGFDKRRLFYTQGDYGLFQCSVPCHKKTYDNREAVYRMVECQGFQADENGVLTMRPGEPVRMKIPSGMIPRCPVCGQPMSMNLRADDTFVQDEGWHAASERYTGFLRSHEDMKVLFLELGVGSNTPGIIKYPFQEMASCWKDAVYVCINREEAYAPEEIAAKSISINDDIGSVIKRLLLR